MGSGGSKTEAVVRCRKRLKFVRAAANYRYELAAAHVSYFRSLRDVGDAIQKFVDKGLVADDSSSSKHGDESSHLLDDDDDDGSHLNVSDSSCEDGDSKDYAQHLRESDDDDTYQQHQHHHNNRTHHYHGRGSEDDMHQHHHNNHTNPHHWRGSEDDMHQHHHNKPRNRNKEDFFDDDASHLQSEEESSSNFHPPGRFNGFWNGFGGGFNEFGNGMYNEPHSNPHHYPNPYQDPHGEPQPWYNSKNTNVNYMKKGAPAAHTVFEEPPPEPSYGYSDSYFNPEAGFGNNGFVSNENVRVNQKKETPPPPSPPKAWGWDFFYPFEVDEYYSSGRYENRSNPSSPDSTGVWEREGIPDLEEETESEVYKKEESLKGKKGKNEAKKDYSNYNSGSYSSRRLPLPKKNGKSKQVPKQNRESSSKSVPSWSSEENVKPYKGADNAKKMYTPPFQPSAPCMVESPSWEKDSSISVPDGSSNPENFVVENTTKRKGVSFEVGEASRWDGDSSKLSSATISLPRWTRDFGEAALRQDCDSSKLSSATISSPRWTRDLGEASWQDGDSSKMCSSTFSSPRGTRDLGEAVAEIRDEFRTAASYGREVAVMLEVRKVPQRCFLKAIISRILFDLFPFSPSLSSRDSPSISIQSAKLASKTKKLAKSYFDDVGKDENAKACNLSLSLDLLFAWEKKLYKEVKDGENLRKMYEKQCKKVKDLDDKGAEISKIDAARTSEKWLGKKLKEKMEASDAISLRIDKLRDEVLQPQVAELIHGLIRMWKAMLKCHQKQFQALKEIKMLRLKVNTSPQTDSTSRATTELERQLCAWCNRFNHWIASQKSYVESLNGWVLHCLEYEPEVTPDGPVPYSPGRLGFPPISVICNDWHQSMEAISEVGVSNAMNTFAENLRQLRKKQDEEGRQRLKAAEQSKEFVKQQKQQQLEGKEKTDLPVHLDLMSQKLAEEWDKHAEAIELLHKAASTSLQGGLIPIFKALEVFSAEALKAHEQVRLSSPGWAHSDFF